MALIAILIIIPIAMLVTVNTSKSYSFSSDQKRLNIVVSFYPLYDFTKNIGKDKLNITTIVPAGVEPHDWEPTARQVTQIQNADVFIYNGAGFESWADSVSAELVVDTSKGLPLLNNSRGENSNSDPHIWLDPILAKQQVISISNGLISADPENAQYYKENTRDYLNKLDMLDKFIRSSLSGCDKSDFISFHNAFGYFAARYSLTQNSLLGPNAEEEPSAKTIKRIIDLANRLDINTIYSEELLDPRLANVIADEMPGGRVLVLSPVESISESELDLGIGYIEKMKENVLNLRAGLECTTIQ